MHWLSSAIGTTRALYSHVLSKTLKGQGADETKRYGYVAWSRDTNARSDSNLRPDGNRGQGSAGHVGTPGSDRWAMMCRPINAAFRASRISQPQADLRDPVRPAAAGRRRSKADEAAGGRGAGPPGFGLTPTTWSLSNPVRLLRR